MILRIASVSRSVRVCVGRGRGCIMEYPSVCVDQSAKCCLLGIKQAKYLSSYANIECKSANLHINMNIHTYMHISISIYILVYECSQLDSKVCAGKLSNICHRV